MERARDAMASLGLETVVGEHVLDRHGYLAGTDEDRAADLIRAFEDPSVAGIVTIRGGWGCARALPHLHWPTIRANPKVVMGYSDVTSLLLALHARTGLVGFHGPNALSTLNDFTVEAVRPLLFGDTPPIELSPDSDEGGISILRPGRARGRLIGGNLTVLSAMAGTPYLPSFEGHILFLEDIREDVYRVDRMMTQLAQAGLLSGLTGFLMGSCRGCVPEEDGIGRFELVDVLRHHIEPLGIPAIMGAPFGHQTDKWTLPLGVMAELNTATGAIRLLEAPVV